MSKMQKINPTIAIQINSDGLLAGMGLLKRAVSASNLSVSDKELLNNFIIPSYYGDLLKKNTDALNLIERLQSR